MAACSRNSFDTKYTEACEQLIKNRLKAPSGYNRFQIVDWTEEGKMFKGISYDAPNTYGTMIRGAGICEYDGPTTADVSTLLMRVRLGGETEVEWYMKLKREAERSN